MWWDRSEHLDAYLAPSLVGSGAGAASSGHWRACVGLEDALGELRRRIDDRPGRLRLRIRLGSTLARPWMLPADCGARDAREVAALAAMLAQDVTGESDAKVWCAPWRPGRPTLSAAVGGSAWRAIEAIADGRRVRLVSVRPWWNAALDDALARSREHAPAIGLTLREPDGLVSARVERGQVIEAAFESPKGHDPEWHLLRRRLAANWHELEAVEHADFAPEGATGALRPAQGVRA